MHKIVLIVFQMVLLSSFSNICQASDPYTPETNQQILVKLPESVILARTEWLNRISKDPAAKVDINYTLQSALKFIQQGRKTSDPRAFSYAEALLMPIMKQSSPPSAALILLASIKDHNHDFQGAMALLRTVLDKEPGNLQARLSLASALTVTGELNEARNNCEKLLSAGRPLIASTCAAAPASLQGKAQQVFQALKGVLGDAQAVLSSGNEEQVWAVTLLGEIGERIGLTKEAEDYFRAALASDPNDSYTLAALSDLLLTEDRFSEVLTLLEGREAIDSLLLRIALAQHAAGDLDLLQVTKSELQARFAAEELRKDSIHLRERVIFELEFMKHPRIALSMARKNWAAQKEPIDLLILAKAAVQTEDDDSLQLVNSWRSRWGWEDVRLDKVLAGVKQ